MTRTRQGGSLAQQHSLRKCRAATCACALAAGVSVAWRQWQGQTEATVVLCYVLCSRVRLMAKGACGLDMAGKAVGLGSVAGKCACARCSGDAWLMAKAKNSGRMLGDGHDAEGVRLYLRHGHGGVATKQGELRPCGVCEPRRDVKTAELAAPCWIRRTCVCRCR
jgi:hypothetical protein